MEIAVRAEAEIVVGGPAVVQAVEVVDVADREVVVDAAAVVVDMAAATAVVAGTNH